MTEIDLSIVVPVYNNADSLTALVDRIIAVLERHGGTFEIIAIDDGSRDESLRLLLRLAEVDPRIRPRALARNFGSQAALCAGFDLARGRRIVCIDADLENAPEDIPKLLAGLDRGFDLACGVRAQRRHAGWWRRLPSALLNQYVRQRTGTRVQDIGCGMRAMDARVVRNLGIEGEARRLLTPLLLRRARSVVEVPIEFLPRHDRSGHSFLSLLAIASDYYLLTARRPFLVTGVAAAVVCGLGVAVIVASVLAASGLLLVPGLILAATGFLGSILSLAGEYAQRIYQLEQGLPFYELRRDEVGPNRLPSSVDADSSEP